MNALESCETVEFHRHVADGPTLGPDVRRDNRERRVLRAMVSTDDSIGHSSAICIRRKGAIDGQEAVENEG